nr:MAG TPA: hypothetical protein [Microviridae sp.]
MNNTDKTFSGQTFSKNQPVHGYDYNENGERIFTIIGEDMIYARIQEANNSTDMEMIKNQLLPAVEADENAVDKYFKSYGDIESLKVGDEIEDSVNKTSDDPFAKTQSDSGQITTKFDSKAGKESGEKEKGGENK